jgi:hypothetical protein
MYSSRRRAIVDERKSVADTQSSAPIRACPLTGSLIARLKDPEDAVPLARATWIAPAGSVAWALEGAPKFVELVNRVHAQMV